MSQSATNPIHLNWVASFQFLMTFLDFSVKKKIYISILLIFTYGLFELASWAMLIILKKNWGLEYAPALLYSFSESNKKALTHLLQENTKKWIGVYSPTLGWSNKKGGRTKLYRTNSQSIRGDRKYSLTPPNQTLRISTFGDSFTFSSDVSNEDAWAERLTSMHPDLEVLNFGVAGYGLDQALLRYKQDGIQFNSHINLIGFMTENINRNVNIYRPFYRPFTEMPLAKPRFILKNNKLVLIKNPMDPFSKYQELLDHPEKVLPRLAVDDFFPNHFFSKEWPIDFLPSIRLFKIVAFKVYQKFTPLTARQYQHGTPAFKITVRIFDEFVRTSLQNNALPIILIFPRINDIIQYQKGEPREYNSLIKNLEEKGYLVIDLLEVFIEQSPIENLKELFITHYSPEANQWVATYIFNYLKNNGLSSLSGVKSRLSHMQTKTALESS